MAFELPKLPYAYDALEPYIDAQTMEVHHLKHHQAYVNKLNEALSDAPEWQEKSLVELLQSLPHLPEEIRTKVRNNAGGHYNHSLFWTMMNPPTGGGGVPKGDLAEAINTAFGSFEKFKEAFSSTAANHFGSGWAHLVIDGDDLRITDSLNQDTPLSDGLQPILVLDVWEHAYYLKYQNRRPEYIENWWNVVNWDEVARLYAEHSKPTEEFNEEEPEKIIDEL